MLANVQSMRKVCDELERIELSGDVALLKQTRQQVRGCVGMRVVVP